MYLEYLAGTQREKDLLHSTVCMSFAFSVKPSPAFCTHSIELSRLVLMASLEFVLPSVEGQHVTPMV